MTETAGETEQPGDSLDVPAAEHDEPLRAEHDAPRAEHDEPLRAEYDALRGEHDELRRRVAVSDEEIDLLQVEVAKNKRGWYKDPSVLVAALALAVSIGAFIVSQVNIIAEREIQDRNRLSDLISELPVAYAEAEQQPTSASSNRVFLISGIAADLIGKLDPEASTPGEKLEVARALAGASDLPTANWLATAAEQQSTNLREKIAAGAMIADIAFQAGDVAGGRDTYRRVVSSLQIPKNELDSPRIRDLQTFFIEVEWATDELFLAMSCEDATEHLRKAEEALNRLPPPQAEGQRPMLDYGVESVAEGCPSAVG